MPGGSSDRTTGPTVCWSNPPSSAAAGTPHGPHVAASSRHWAYVSPLLSMCQMTVASLRITATRATVGPRRRLTRLNQSRSRASRRRTLWTSWAKSDRAVALPALVIRPSRWSFSPLFRQPGVSPQ